MDMYAMTLHGKLYVFLIQLCHILESVDTKKNCTASLVIAIPVLLDLGVVVGRQRQEDQEIKIIFRHISSSWSAWAT